MELHRNANDLSNQKFGDLTAIVAVGRSPRRSLIWECDCICGRTVNRTSDTLRQGKSKSCGCLQYGKQAIEKRSLSQRKTGAAARKEYRHIMQGAKNRGHVFQLSFDQFLILSKAPCCYCGTSHSKAIKTKYEEFVANGIDRIDNSLGYIEGNVVSCCKTCNYMKRDLSVSDFLEHVRNVVTYSK